MGLGGHGAAFWPAVPFAFVEYVDLKRRPLLAEIVGRSDIRSYAGGNIDQFH
jgi:hypothetical protein